MEFLRILLPLILVRSLSVILSDAGIWGKPADKNRIDDNYTQYVVLDGETKQITGGGIGWS